MSLKHLMHWARRSATFLPRSANKSPAKRPMIQQQNPSQKLAKKFLFWLKLISIKFLNYLYLVEVITLFVMIFRFPPNDIPPYLLIFAFIEGQGRVLWSYNPFFVIVFDVVMLSWSFRVFYTKKRLINIDLIPFWSQGLSCKYCCWLFF